MPLGALVAIAVVFAIGPAVASAQGAIAVPQGSNFTVENGTECAANADVVISYASPARDAVRVGTTISDGAGHFSTDIRLPDNVALGSGTVSVDCGIADAVLLYDIEVVASTSADLLSYVPYLLGAVAELAVLGIIGVRIAGAKERKAKAAATPAELPEPESVVPVPVPQDDEDDPDYWFWDAKTERGLVKRLACLSEQTFFLHEVPAAAFTALLENIATVGPEAALETAFFLVAGMFGNILNLRHLAMLIGEDRAVYGVQARGLRGDEDPHDRFEEMATAYLEEIREIQPEGPYYLGGFSGGGITAYEMAQQLQAAGEEVAMIVMLDTPVPGLGGELTKADKVLMQVQRMQRMKHNWVRWYVKGKLDFHNNAREIESAEAHEDEFRTEAITDAFMRAVESYTAEPYTGDIHIYRPRLNEEFKVTGARYIDHQFNFQVADNGWTPYVGDLTVREVPGDHDSMVLEPNVRVLASHVIADIAAVEAAASIQSSQHSAASESA